VRDFKSFVGQGLRWLRRAVILASEKCTGYAREKRHFLQEHGYPLNLLTPHSFSEKVTWKKIYDRNPLLRVTADKYTVRDYVKKVLGADAAAHILIPLLHATDDPATIPFETLPQDYIIKSSHGSGWNIIVRGGQVDRDHARAACHTWLVEPYGGTKFEWAYEGLKPRIVIETLLQQPDGRVPEDYKFFMIHGVCRMILVDQDRFEDHVKVLYDRDWNMLQVMRGEKAGRPQARPRNLERMLDLAAKLSQDFDFVRVDLYDMGDKVYFGELTHYPASGREKFTPRSFDFELGAFWQLKPGYWKTDV
jgi:hypothetical protein